MGLGHPGFPLTPERAEGQPSPLGIYRRIARPEHRYAVSTRFVVAGTVLLAIASYLALRPIAGPVTDWTGLGVLILVAAAGNLPARSPSTSSRRVHISMLAALTLAAVPLGLAAGLPLLAAAHALAQAGRQAPIRVVFNAAMSVVVGMAGLLAYWSLRGPVLVDGAAAGAPVVVHIGWALLLANLLQLVVNAWLISLVQWASRAVALADQFRALILRSGLTYLATGSLSILIVTVWQIAGGGPGSIVLLLPCLVAARWALGHERAEDLMQVRVVDTLNAAIDARFPGAAAHSADVARLAEWLAEEIDLGPSRSEDLALAGALYRLDSLSTPRGVEPAPRPARALTEVDFLQGILPILEHRRDGASTSTATAGRVISVAEAYVVARRDPLIGDRYAAYDAIAGRSDLDSIILVALRRVVDRIDPLPPMVGRHRA
ncbi:hypothetical protein [Nostocoides veronense]|uniref:Uncharacterized protein n=1 Tax=Nostocoides veronense TaxID=330836 RepID=A0ABN2LYG7_9MICO